MLGDMKLRRTINLGICLDSLENQGIAAFGNHFFEKKLRKN